MVTIVLKRVENPLDFGVVVINDEGRIERFLEKPTWGQVFSDTVNTGIYVLEPEVFDYIPAGQPVRLQPGAVPQAVRDGRAALRLRRRRLLAGHRQPAASTSPPTATCSTARCRRRSPASGSRTDIYIGENVNLDSLENVTGPGRSSATTPRSTATARIGAYTVLGSNVVVKDHAETRISVIDSNTYVGSGTKVYGAIVGQELRRQARRQHQRGRRRRRRVRDRRAGLHRPRRQDLPVQDRRVGRPDQHQHHLGVARHARSCSARTAWSG